MGVLGALLDEPQPDFGTVGFGCAKTPISVSLMTRCLRVAVGGLGAIGFKVAQALDQGLPGLQLVAVSARDHDRAANRMADFQRVVPVLSLKDLAKEADVVIECAPARVFNQVAEPAIEAGRIFIPLSAGALLDRMDLVERARKTGARIMVPTGGILGLDAVRAVACGAVDEVRIITRKPPMALAGAPYLEEVGIELDAVTKPLRVFDGNARDAARAFPANVNVAAALSLAGIGPQRTRVEIWADPGLNRNTHRIVVEAQAARLDMNVEGLPSPDNPRTGQLTPLSVLALLRRLTEPLCVGT